MNGKIGMSASNVLTDSPSYIDELKPVDIWPGFSISLRQRVRKISHNKARCSNLIQHKSRARRGSFTGQRARELLPCLHFTNREGMLARKQAYLKETGMKREKVNFEEIFQAFEKKIEFPHTYTPPKIPVELQIFTELLALAGAFVILSESEDQPKRPKV